MGAATQLDSNTKLGWLQTILFANSAPRPALGDWASGSGHCVPL